MRLGLALHMRHLKSAVKGMSLLTAFLPPSSFLGEFLWSKVALPRILLGLCFIISCTLWVSPSSLLGCAAHCSEVVGHLLLLSPGFVPCNLKHLEYSRRFLCLLALVRFSQLSRDKRGETGYILPSSLCMGPPMAGKWLCPPQDFLGPRSSPSAHLFRDGLVQHLPMLVLWWALRGSACCLVVFPHPAIPFKNNPFIELTSNFLVWMCYLFSWGSGW